MKSYKKILSVVLAAGMVMSLTACGGKDTESASVDIKEAAANLTVQGGHNDDISMGTWWLQHYDSNDTELEASADYTTAILNIESNDPAKMAEGEVNKKVCELKFNKVKEIEEKYNVKFHWDNLTFQGVQESINTSILAGAPDCDVYLCQADMAYPAQANGLTLDLKTILPADHDLLTNQVVATYLDLGDGKVSILKKKSGMDNTYPIGFNMQMLEDNNLEDPRVLYERGEWTWDKFNEYCRTLTQDTDGDGVVDQYGFCGYAGDVFTELLMSNGATIATGKTQTLTDSKVAECLQELQDLYLTYNVCYPYDFQAEGGDPSTSMRNQYTQGNIGMFPIACWIQSGNADYDWEGKGEVDELAWDIAYVRWPVGPSGNKDTNAGFNDTGNEVYIIPANVQDPETVINVLYDMWNWYDFDVELRDDPATLNWWFTTTARAENKDLQDENFAVQKECLAHTQVDLYNSLGVYYDLESIIYGTMTPAQFQETYKQEIQDALDAIFGN